MTAPAPQIYLSLTDLWHAVKAARKWIFTLSLSFSLLAFCYALTRPAIYRAEGTFKDQGKSASSLSGGPGALLEGLSLGNLMGSGSDPRASVISVMKSRSLMEDLVRSLNLQAHLQEDLGIPLWRRAADNLRLEKLYLVAGLRRSSPVLYRLPLADRPLTVRCRHVVYPRELLLALEIRFLTAHDYEVIEEGIKVGTGILGTPFERSGYSFILEKANAGELTGRLYQLTLAPLDQVAAGLAEQISFIANKKNPGVIEISFAGQDRHLAADVVNGVMEQYHIYLKRERDRQATEQIAYLQQRQNEANEKLRGLMHTYAETVAGRIGSGSYPDVAFESQILAERQEKLRAKLSEVDLNIKRLDAVTLGDYAWLVGKGETELVGKLAAELHQTRRKKAVLESALEEQALAARANAFSQEEQWLLLEQARHGVEQCQELIAQVDTRSSALPQELPRVADNGFVAHLWWQQLEGYHRAWVQADEGSRPAREKDFKRHKKRFQHHLSQLAESMRTQETVLKERLSAFEEGGAELQALEPEMMSQMLLKFSEEAEKAHLKRATCANVLDQIGLPDFDVAALSDLLPDKSSVDLIMRANGLRVRLNDIHNHTARELEVIREEYAVVQSLLAARVQQTALFEQVRLQRIKDKIQTLEAIQNDQLAQKIALLEQQLSDQVATQKRHLSQEKQLMRRQQEDLVGELDRLPQRWLIEKEIAIETEITAQMVGKIGELVEGRNISHNLETIGATPLDSAVPPVLPRAPTLVGLMAAVFLGSSFFFSAGVAAKALVRGVVATPHNVALQGRPAVGSLSNGVASNAPSHKDFETLRKAMAILEEVGKRRDRGSSLARTALLVVSSGPFYVPTLAELFSRVGHKVLVMEASLDQPDALVDDNNTLLAYLEGRCARPNPIARRGYDLITAGGLTPYAAEMIQQPAFAYLLNDFRTSYDWIFLISRRPTVAIENSLLLRHADVVLVTLSGEPLEAVKPYLASAAPTAFLFG